MLGLLAKKVGMTQIFNEEGLQVGVTVLEVGPCFVTDLRTPEKHGYTAVQIGFSAEPERKLTKAQQGHLKKAGLAGLKYVREIRTETLEGLSVGQKLLVDNFEEGESVDVQGISIGKGFQGVVKRWHFKGAQTMSHGTKMGREPGSVGSRAGGVGCRKETPKGKKLPGRMGNEVVTVANLKILKVDTENNLLVVRGGVPGPEGQCLVVRTALKKGVKRNWKVSAPAEQAKEAPSKKSAKEGSEAPGDNS
ncbi:MAG TPA: 50S ribosomal protein L3 [Verrucomicrobiae bacterium]|jgi:large subunit ribosomal protein L3|nr:50S ribosomal protein L3 [Verrucomicrobiae bacterium]